MSFQEFKNLTVIRKKGEIPAVPFLSIKEKILGKKYNLTIIFCTPKESKEKNKLYRGKDYPTNILSFPLGDDEGEIYISLSTAKKDAAKFEMTYLEFLHLLIIHGALHLKGYDHSSTMEGLEDSYLSKFYKSGKTNRTYTHRD
jgi:probable rRNA maturation factor